MRPVQPVEKASQAGLPGCRAEACIGVLSRGLSHGLLQLGRVDQPDEPVGGVVDVRFCPALTLGIDTLCVLDRDQAVIDQAGAFGGQEFGRGRPVRRDYRLAAIGRMGGQQAEAFRSMQAQRDRAGLDQSQHLRVGEVLHQQGDVRPVADPRRKPGHLAGTLRRAGHFQDEMCRTRRRSRSSLERGQGAERVLAGRRGPQIAQGQHPDGFGLPGKPGWMFSRSGGENRRRQDFGDTVAGQDACYGIGGEARRRPHGIDKTGGLAPVLRGTLQFPDPVAGMRHAPLAGAGDAHGKFQQLIRVEMAHTQGCLGAVVRCRSGGAKPRIDAPGPCIVSGLHHGAGELPGGFADAENFTMKPLDPDGHAGHVGHAARCEACADVRIGLEGCPVGGRLQAHKRFPGRKG